MDTEAALINNFYALLTRSASCIKMRGSQMKIENDSVTALNGSEMKAAANGKAIHLDDSVA